MCKKSYKVISLGTSNIKGQYENLFLNTNNKIGNWKQKYYFTNYIKIIYYLEVTLTKYVQGLYTENYRTLLKEILKDKHRDTVYHLIRRIN